MKQWYALYVFLLYSYGLAISGVAVELHLFNTYIWCLRYKKSIRNPIVQIWRSWGWFPVNPNNPVYFLTLCCFCVIWERSIVSIPFSSDSLVSKSLITNSQGKRFHVMTSTYDNPDRHAMRAHAASYAEPCNHYRVVTCLLHARCLLISCH